MGGIGSHLKVSQVDQSVCLGNELNNLSARKDFLLKNIKSSHPNDGDDDDVDGDDGEDEDGDGKEAVEATWRRFGAGEKLGNFPS